MKGNVKGKGNSTIAGALKSFSGFLNIYFYTELFFHYSNVFSKRNYNDCILCNYFYKRVQLL